MDWINIDFLLSIRKNVWPQSRYKECRYVRGHATRRRGLLYASLGKVQHRKRHCCLHQKGIRQKVQPHMALHCWPQLWQLCHTRDQALHLLLSGTSCHLIIQIGLDENENSLNWRRIIIWKELNKNNVLNFTYLSSIWFIYACNLLCLINNKVFVKIYFYLIWNEIFSLGGGGNGKWR